MFIKIMTGLFMTPVVACSQPSLKLAWLPVHPGMKITDSSQFTQ